MSFVNANPEALHTAAARLSTIGAAVDAQSAGAAAPTTGVVPAASDQVSALAASLFAAHGQQYQAVIAQAKAVHEQFVQMMRTGGNTYQLTEAANASAAG